MNEDLPYSQASENNKLAILEMLNKHLLSKKSLLEIGGGTGQHAVFFAEKFPLLNWQSTDIGENVENLNRRIELANLGNAPSATALNVDSESWVEGSHQAHSHDVIFTANSLHIMSENSVKNFFAGVKNCLLTEGILIVYGPFKYKGEFTTESNASFDLWLKDRNPLSGVRDFETVNALAAGDGLVLIEDNPMPANNQLLVWEKKH